MNRKRMPLLCLGLWAAMAGVTLADGSLLNGLSPRSIGRGGTNQGFADNGALLCDNQAAAVNIEGERMVDVGVDMMLTDFHYSNNYNGGVSTFGVFPLPQVAMIRRSEDGDWAYGVGFFVPAGFSESYDMQGPPQLSGQQGYKSIGMLGKALPGIAHRVTDRLSIGATLGVGISHVELEGPYFLQSPSAFRGAGTLLDVQQTGASLVYSFGLQYKLTDATTLGATYQSESRFELDGRTVVTIPGLGSSEYASSMDITWPRTVALGVRHELSPCRTVSADVIYTAWSAAFDQLGLRLSDPSTQGFPALDEQVPLRWSDTLSVRLGYEQKLDCNRTFRLGYVHHQNPIPNGTLTPYIQAIPEHSMSVGYGWMWNCWNVDMAYMYSFGPNPQVGTSDFVGGDFDNSNHRAQTHCIALSFMRQF
jgi:long-chain fatty acid transport protein